MDNPETMTVLGTYELTGQMTNDNGGYSVWTFGNKDNKTYFVKQFLSPKYPENDANLSPERKQKRLAQCEAFEQRKAALYQSLNENSNGIPVRVTEFFRVGTKYYAAMPKVEAVSRTVEEISALPPGELKLLCATVASGVASFHRGRIVHADLKPDNIMFTRSKSGAVTAKIIDFDSSFLETEPPQAGEEIVGDLVYFSPEACRCIWGDTVELTCKMDVFALGVLFHQYYTGELPRFDGNMYGYAGEAVANGETLVVSEKVPEEYRTLIQRMLSANPSLRPSAEEVFDAFKGRKPKLPPPPVEPPVPPTEPRRHRPPVAPPRPPEEAQLKMGKWFGMGGDL